VVHTSKGQQWASSQQR